MSKTAIFWIRDGVLVDRMHVNPVAFAVAALHCGERQAAAKIGLTTLINFGFETSGISCADKMTKFNSEHLQLVPDVESAAQFYNALATDAGGKCNFFPGICDLVASLKDAGALNFITSAVEQTVLDAWAAGSQGALVCNKLTEILGQRPDFKKGKDHFAYVCEQYSVDKIIYIADATAEIKTGSEYSELFNIAPIGFAHEITVAKVREACKMVMHSYQQHSGAEDSNFWARFPLLEEELSLPNEARLSLTLKNAGAAYVASGRADTIARELENYFESCGLLESKA